MLVIIDPGLRTTVQDLGRVGYAAAGVPRGGAGDALSLRIGNRLLGNDEGAAAIEMTLIGATVVFEHTSLICLAGAGAPRARTGRDGRWRMVRPWRPMLLNAGEELGIGPIERGARAYLCIAGGVPTPMVLGSRSVLASCGLGGRVLNAGDRVPIGAPRAGLQVSPLDETLQRSLRSTTGRRVLRVVPGAHFDAFGTKAVRRFAQERFEVSSQSDRVGVRLSGGTLPSPDSGTLGSEGVVAGCVQVPPSGEPIVLGVDGPTTGGYPVIACVIAADLPALGQLCPRDEVRFEWTDHARAIELLHESERLVGSVAMARVSPRYRRSRVVHLGCDTGEAPPGALRLREQSMLGSLSAVSIACGGHTGDADSMREAVAGAITHGCLIGAHPSYPDREWFGRRRVEIAHAELMRSVRSQIASLVRVCREMGTTVGFVKAHGALYHDLSRDRSLAMGYARAVRAECPGATMVGAAGSTALELWRGMGLGVLGEGFVDRVYEPDASLRDRSLWGALVDDPSEAARRALAMVRGEGVIAHDGTVIPMEVGMLCVHADTPNAPAIAAAVHSALDAAGIVRG